jgi:radical SAM protein with 4Fe4S-binding SPASM domain
MRKLLETCGFKPRVAVWELTLRCNLSCRHCGSRAGKARSDELSLDESFALIDELAELGCRFLTLSGGEPLMYENWPLLAARAIERGLTVGMISNGVLWNDEHAEQAKRLGLNTVAFSLDGFKESHEYQRRVPGQWQMVLDAVDNCVAHGIRCSIVTTVNRRNQSELESLRALLRSHGVSRWQVQFATSGGNMADNRGLLMAPEDLLDVIPRLAKMCSDKVLPKLFTGHNVGYYGEYEEALRTNAELLPVWTGCTAGSSVIGIESNGNIKGCLSLPSAMNGEDRFVEGNVRQSTLKEIWTKPGAFAYNREFSPEMLGGFCRTCDYAEICRGGCTWTTFSEHGPIRDNPYCYWRQKQRVEEARTSRRHLPITE